MKIHLIALIFVSLTGYLTFAQESNPRNAQPQLSIKQSKYVNFINSSVTASEGAILFEGRFIVLGEGVYGHFDMIAYNDSGKVVQKAISEDRAWRRDAGSKLKTITLSITSEQPAEIEVSFHEMRINPDAGACKQ
ncbi:MAG: hypothetical protein GX556_15410 [Fibrobacter sp.]|nr:hypothetical protein [Fibrobacter sp.]